jgi:hypothetical protein
VGSGALRGRREVLANFIDDEMGSTVIIADPAAVPQSVVTYRKGIDQASETILVGQSVVAPRSPSSRGPCFQMEMDPYMCYQAKVPRSSWGSQINR